MQILGFAIGSVQPITLGQPTPTFTLDLEIPPMNVLSRTFVTSYMDLGSENFVASGIQMCRTRNADGSDTVHDFSRSFTGMTDWIALANVDSITFAWGLGAGSTGWPISVPDVTQADIVMETWFWSV